MDPVKQFEVERKERIANQGKNKSLVQAGKAFFQETIYSQYSYNFNWFGRPIIQYPQDVMAMQEIIWEVKPDIIIETGIAHGGTVLFYASMLQLLGGDRQLVSVDIDIREHNRREIENHPLYRNVTMLEGSATDQTIVDTIYNFAEGRNNPLVVLDSNHTHAHCLREMELYAPLVRKGSYLVVMDTVIEDLSAPTYGNRPWGPGDNPKTAVYEYLKKDDRFKIDTSINDKLIMSVAPDGYLKCIKD